MHDLDQNGCFKKKNEKMKEGLEAQPQNKLF